MEVGNYLCPWPAQNLLSSTPYPSIAHTLSRFSLGTNRPGSKRPNNWFPVSIPPPLLPFWNQSRLQWLSLPLTSPTPLPPNPALHIPFILPSLPSTSFLRLPLLLRLLRTSFFNWNSSLWNGKVIYFDSSGIWLAVLSGATCNVTGNMATVNILPPCHEIHFGRSGNE